MTYKARPIFAFALALVAAFAVAGQAGATGGSHSSGAPSAPHIPDGSLTYVCKVELQQWKGKKSTTAVLEGIRFDRASIVDHGGSAHWQADPKAAWVVSRNVDFEKIKIDASEAADMLTGASFWMRFDKDWNSNEEKVRLSAMLERVRRGDKISAHGEATAPLATPWISAESTLYVNVAHGRNEKMASIEVTCQKAE